MGLFNPYSPAVNAIIIYIILMTILIIIKPDFLYDHQNNKFREFGDGPGQTYFTILVTGIFASIIIYYIFSSIATTKYKKMRYYHKYS